MPKSYNKVSRWRGLDLGDNKRRLYRPPCRKFNSDTNTITVKVKPQPKKGELIDSFRKKALIKIAWHLDIPSPKSIDRADGQFLNQNYEDWYQEYYDSWVGASKKDLCDAIWIALGEDNHISASNSKFNF